MFGAKSCTTRTTARVLKPIIEALTTSGGGRFEIVKGAVDRGAFNDLRLIEPSIRALDDNYPELADLVAEKILPGYGPSIIPLLKPKLELKGKRSDARRLTILHRLDPAGTIELCKKALDEGSPDVKVAAIACLGKHEECLPVLLDQTTSKNKTIRAAALEALAAHERPEITKLFTDLIKGKALDLLAKPLRAIRNQEVMNSLLGEGKRVFELLLKGDAEQLPRYSEILDCLQQRKDAEVEELLLNCFGQCDKLAKLKAAKNSSITGADLMTSLATLLYAIGSSKAFEAVLEKRNVLPSTAFSQVLGSALRIWPADKIYQEFAPLLEQKKGAGKEKSEELQRTIYAAAYLNGFSVFGELVEAEPDSSDAQALKQVVWDPRWLDAAIKADQPATVCRFARPGHKGVVTYLLKLLDTKTQFQLPTGLIIQALARCQYPKLTDCFVELVKKKTKRAQYVDWELQQLFGSAHYLTAADLPKLDAFAATLDEKFVDAFLEALGPLRPARSDTSGPSDDP